jgi:hypothetical protein
VVDRAVRVDRPLRLGHELHELALDRVRIVAAGERQALVYALHVRVDGEPRNAEGVAEYDVRGFARHAAQRSQFFQRLRHGSAEALDHVPRRGQDRLRLLPKESGGADDRFDLGRIRVRQRSRRAVGAKQLGRHLVDLGVRALCREDRGDEQLKRRLEVEGTLGVGIGARQLARDASRALLLRR